MTTPFPSGDSLPSVRKRPLMLRWSTWLATAAVIGYGVAYAMHWDDRGLLWIKERFESPAEQRASVWLPDYHADIDAKVLPGMEDDEASDVFLRPANQNPVRGDGQEPVPGSTDAGR